MTDGFLSRWSRRKSGIATNAPSEKSKTEALIKSSEDLHAEKGAEEVPPPPTLEDVAKKDRLDPDFSAFMRPDVDPAVQQAALKKMFTDPHFNIMDGLDIYIDDYTKPDPLPPGMLERMVQSDMLNLLRKSGDHAPKEVGHDEIESPHSQAEIGSVKQESQTALTSTQQKTSTQLAKEQNEELNEVPIESAQKKT